MTITRKTRVTTDGRRGIAYLHELSTRPFLTSVAACKRFINARLGEN